MRLIPLKPREIISVLYKLGFREVHQSGSHKIFQHLIKKTIVPVPFHSKEIKKGLVAEIAKQAGLKVRDFLRILKEK